MKHQSAPRQPKILSDKATSNYQKQQDTFKTANVRKKYEPSSSTQADEKADQAKAAVVAKPANKNLAAEWKDVKTQKADRVTTDDARLSTYGCEDGRMPRSFGELTHKGIYAKKSSNPGEGY